MVEGRWEKREEKMNDGRRKMGAKGRKNERW